MSPKQLPLTRALNGVPLWVEGFVFQRQDHLGDEEFKRLEAAAATRRLLLELREVWEWSQRFHRRALVGNFYWDGLMILFSMFGMFKKLFHRTTRENG